MLSIDELANGRIFILKLWSSAGTVSCWVETLRGKLATRWYDIYRNCDWETLRREASEVFRHPASEADTETVRASNRCVVIHTRAVKTDELEMGKRQGQAMIWEGGPPNPIMPNGT